MESKAISMSSISIAALLAILNSFPAVLAPMALSSVLLEPSLVGVFISVGILIGLYLLAGYWRLGFQRTFFTDLRTHWTLSLLANGVMVAVYLVFNLMNLLIWPSIVFWASGFGLYFESIGAGRKVPANEEGTL